MLFLAAFASFARRGAGRAWLSACAVKRYCFQSFQVLR